MSLRLKKSRKKNLLQKYFFGGEYHSRSTCGHIFDVVKDFFRRLENKNQIKYLVFSFISRMLGHPVVALRLTGLGETTGLANKLNHSFYTNGYKTKSFYNA